MNKDYLRIQTKKISILKKIFDGLTDFIDDVNIRILSERALNFYKDDEFTKDNLEELTLTELRDLCSNNKIVFDDEDNEKEIKERILNSNKLNLKNIRRKFDGYKSLNINSLDSTQTFMVDIKIIGFNDIFCKKQIYDISFNLQDFCKILKSFDKINETINLCIKDDSKNVFKILSKKLDCEIRLLNPNYNDSGKIDPFFDCRIEMDINDFINVFSNKLMSDRVEIECNKDYISFCNIEQNCKLKYKYDKSELLCYIVRSNKIKIKNIFNPKYMNIWGNKDFFSNKVVLLLKQDNPLCIYYELKQDDNKYGYIITYLSPQSDKDILDTFDDDDFDEVVYKENNNIK